MGNRTSTEISKKKYRSSSMTAKSATKLTNNTTSFSSTKEQTLSRISAGSKTGWPLPQREGVFLPEYPAKPAIDFNDFRVLGHIGRGAFGHVLKVQRKTTCQIYAMKVLDKLEIFRQKAVQQCKDEIKIQSSLTCAFIVHARHAWQTKRHLYIILDYSERGDLFAVWTREKRFNEPTVRQYAAEMAVALDFLHRSGVIYRDLKLENVLLDVDGKFVVSGLIGECEAVSMSILVLDSSDFILLTDN
jgi:serine/threonine protein kinase